MQRPLERFDNVNLLRAAAAVAVVVYHVIEHGRWLTFPAQGPWSAFRLGWLGVDLFFVVSGFVIAYSAIVLHRASPAEFARQYWSRRLTRILPLYLLTLALWIPLAWPGFFELPARAWGWQLAAHLAFIHSFWPETHGAIVGANWSLALEMQFYVAVALLVGWIDRTPAWRLWLYAVLVSWAWRGAMFVLYGHIDGAYTFVRTTQLPGMLDEFAAGIVLAKWVLAAPAQRRPWEGIAWLAAAGALGTLTMAVYWPRSAYWNDAAMVVLWRTPLAVSLACVVGAAVHLPQVLRHRGLRPLDYLGDVSYGLYLWHLFAIQLVIHMAGVRGWQALAPVLVLTLLLAAASWRYVERPAMRLVRRPARALPEPAARTA